jgi:hypothetical protein
MVGKEAPKMSSKLVESPSSYLKRSNNLWQLLYSFRSANNSTMVVLIAVSICRINHPPTITPNNLHVWTEFTASTSKNLQRQP